jgi:uncharacterized protein (TIGR01244 family)
VNLKHVSESFAVSPQVRPEDMPAIAGRFAMLINDRPDCEEPGQPTSDELQQAAAKAGLDYRYIPVVPGNLGDREVQEFVKAMSAADGPVLAFCRTGTRSISLWALSQAANRGAASVLEQAANAGYNLGGLAERVAAASKA